MGCCGYINSIIAVLIYPYWNVNSNVTSGAGSSGIVLIYPYWNVNHEDGAWHMHGFIVLIYPYWNVN